MTATNQTILGHALEALGAAVGASLKLDANGTATLAFAGSQEMTLEAPAGSDQIFLHGPIGRLPVRHADRVAREALARNLFKVPVAGAWIALDERGDTLLLCCAVPAETIAQGGLASLLLTLFAEQASLARAFSRSAFLAGREAERAEESAAAAPLLRM